MTYNISRHTLYAILSAVEEDLRELLLTHLAEHTPVEDLLGAELLKGAQERMARDATGSDPNDPADILDYTDFADLYTALNRWRKDLPARVADFIRTRTPAFERLVPIRNRVAHSRPLQFDDLSTTLDAAHDLARSSDHVWSNVKGTLDKLSADPSFVLGLKIPTYRSDSDRNHNLPTPDFDETGFLGRRQDVAALLKLCLGPYPVITIVGEGGLGKTALALKVAYDLLDEQSCPFDMVVWTTAKTTQLTAQEIVRIKGAICDSLGVLTSVASHFAPASPGDPTQEVLDYMGTFKILLVIDNLETVLDDRIRGFLQSLPIGSKVLMTSRIGLGALEYPFKLKPMDQSDAVQLMRALAKVRQVPVLATMPTKELAAYPARLHMNPGFMKWFVSAIQSGRRPEEVLFAPHLFLDFCMSNVYEYLSQESRAVLQTMLCVPGRQSQAALAFLTEFETIVVQRALQQLLATNMVAMLSLPRGSSFETQYDISELARTYLAKHHPPAEPEAKRLTHRRYQLVQASEQLRADHTNNPYAAASIAMRSDQDVIVAKYLRDALNFAFKNDSQTADEMLAKARELAPEFFEVHRVEAYVRCRQGNFSAAHDAYEAAVELEPGAAPLRLFYGGFLLRYLDDVSGALTHLREANRLDPRAANIQLELARASLYSKDFSAARAAIDALLKRADLSEHESRKSYNLHLQYFQRQAEYQLSLRDQIASLDALESLKAAFVACPPRLLDTKQWEVLQRSILSARRCCQALSDPALFGRAVKIRDWLESATTDAIGVGARGTIYRLNKSDGYGYVLLDDQSEYRFERASLSEPTRWGQLAPGARVSFQIERRRGGVARVSGLTILP